ncbi:hypothetical protein AQI95_35560 [Streptomyces yokosukanensis]|uniref:Ricin B lectin domain-containing protein n=1 Tax=Streptomyces yokosukanensis TaxID=67386 RepID=A0A117PZA6_9ACTN|nr:RICIN domain-containing protein [Streptomyces yokosukanensis]KUN00086.1 hypothetical protein AQI95_35560 [Streptomyces yokosukanensis]
MRSPRARLALVVAGLLTALVAGAPGSGASTRVADPALRAGVGPFRVRNQGTGRCIGFPAGDDRTRTWDCTTEAYQLWDLVADGLGRYQMVNRRDGRCLAGWAQGPERWATWLSTCDRTFRDVDQLWYVYPASSADPAPIANLYGRVLEPDRGRGGANEAPAVIYDNQGLPDQQWTLKYVM